MRPRNRRQAREAALRALYSVEIGGVSVEEAVVDMCESARLSEDLEGFAKRLVLGVSEKDSEIRDALVSSLESWDVGRLAAVDRHLLRIGAYELLFCDDVPPKVTLNEAIELAKKYGSADSGKFVNGVLAGVLREHPKGEICEGSEPEATPEPLPEIERLEPGSEELCKLREAGAVPVPPENETV